MRLSEVKENRIVIITKVLGHGSFRRRIAEMGFVRGQEVKVLKNAPLKDPVEYRVMGYNVSLRLEEAKHIEVITPAEAMHKTPRPFEGIIDLETLKTSAHEKGRNINIALVGNPNCGKTTLFNQASGAKEHVGNYSGVTVDAQKASFQHNDYTLNLLDLPGTYSFNAYSPEELYARNYILGETPDIIINVLDASNLERNLYLTTQLIDMDIKVVIALNMYDDLKAGGAKLETEKLGRMLGIPIVPTTASKGHGIDKLLNKVIEVYEERDPIVRHIHINYGHEVEKSIQMIRDEIRLSKPLSANISSRYLAIRLLDKDPESLTMLNRFPNIDSIITAADNEAVRLHSRLAEDSSHLITDAKYGFIAGALKETFSDGIHRRHVLTEKIDKILTHKLLGFPVFLSFMFIAFFSTFTLGAHPMEWIDAGMAALSDLVYQTMPAGMLKDLLVDGIIGGIGSIIVFLPNILILFFFISLMEDSGYMARAAFIMDKLMHKIGLHGRSFIPMVIGFGCNVPAIMATRTLRNRTDRLLTMLIIPFMSCSARLPVYIVLIAAFFPSHPTLILMALYLGGIVLAIIMANILNRTLFKRKEAPFVMELPPYRMPTAKNTLLHMWEKGSQYLKKIGGTILVAVIIIWALEYFPREVENASHFANKREQIEQQFQKQRQSDLMRIRELQQIRDQKLADIDADQEAIRIENSYLGRIGKMVQPVMQPLGFDWKMSVSLLAGIPAKEIVISTMGVLFQADDGSSGTLMLQNKLKSEVHQHGKLKGKSLFTKPVALAFLVFVLIYFPCIAVVATIKRESGSWKWALFTVGYTTILAWLAAFLTRTLFSLIL